MTNPLIEKYFELYPEKKEKPKLPRIEDYNGEKTIAEELKELRDTSTIPITKLTSYDNESLNDSFLQIAERVKNKQAKIYSMNMDYDHQTRTQRITLS